MGRDGRVVRLWSAKPATPVQIRFAPPFLLQFMIYGVMAEWLGSGLQNQLHRFKSGSRLHLSNLETAMFQGFFVYTFYRTILCDFRYQIIICLYSAPILSKGRLLFSPESLNYV